MSTYVCLRCRTSLRPSIRAQYRFLTSNSTLTSSSSDNPNDTRSLKQNKIKHSSPHRQPNEQPPNDIKPGIHDDIKPSTQKQPLDIDALLSKPTWSVRSLLPTATDTLSNEITPQKLHHLLRLSALPQPSSPAEEASMLKTLHSQLHFLRDIQSVDTEGVEPLQSIRDETEEGVRERTIGLDTPEIKEALAREVVRGRNRRPRRKRGVDAGKVDTRGVEDWDVLSTAGRTEGRYFVVKSGKE